MKKIFPALALSLTAVLGFPARVNADVVYSPFESSAGYSVLSNPLISLLIIAAIISGIIIIAKKKK